MCADQKKADDGKALGVLTSVHFAPLRLVQLDSDERRNPGVVYAGTRS